MRRWIAAALTAPLLSGCGADYLFQSASGQLDLIARAKPLDEVIVATGDARLKDRLERARAIRQFASAALGLPDNGSFTRYADLGRPFVLWNVFAAPELSLKPREWCFPVAGCVNYRGYFREDEARAEAARLRDEGYDVHVGGVPAYSTLGWFDDPILSSFIRYPDLELARLVFHELAHQVVYAKDDSTFNESFAVAVEEAGLARWIASRPPAEAQKLAADRERGERLRAEFRRLVRGARASLAASYAGAADVASKRRAKRDALESMRVAYIEAKAGEPGLAAFDRWFAGDGGTGPNNASFVSMGLYSDAVPGFRALLAQEEGDLPRFYGRARELAAMPRAERHAVLAAIAAPTLASPATAAPTLAR
ncbi:MAG: aminopeptidase [Betaproteobacteria bacterium]